LAFGILPLVVRNRILRRYRRAFERDAERFEALMRERGVPQEEIKAEVLKVRQDFGADTESKFRRRTSLPAAIIGGIAVGLILLLTLSIPWFAVPKASQARSGREVSPIRILELTVLAVGANKATIQATGKPGETTTIDALRTRSLLYLGQAGGTLVFFDGVSKEAVLVPSSSAVVTVKS
jgi:hypothetical protein